MDGRTELKAANNYKGIPKGLKKFLIRAIILFISWKLIYLFILQPTDFPDKQLIDIVLLGTFQMLKPIYHHLDIIGDTIYINRHNTLTVAKACNGLELIVLYLGFLLCLPTNTKRLISFLLAGPILIVFLNMLRCTALAVMFYNSYSLADFAHHYIFKLVIYAVTFFMWIWYAKDYKGYGDKVENSNIA